MHWRSNSFIVPHGNAGKQFVLELARLFQAAGEGSTLESIALKAAFTWCALVLQKPSRTSKNKDHVSCLEKRLKLWNDGNLNDLVLEGRAIQLRLGGKFHSYDSSTDSNGRLAYFFAKLMFDGKQNLYYSYSQVCIGEDVFIDASNSHTYHFLCPCGSCLQSLSTSDFSYI